MDLPHIQDHLARLYPGHRIVRMVPMGPDGARGADASSKAAGYGRPVRIDLEGPNGAPLQLVWRTSASDQLGHDRRADRMAGNMLAFDDFRLIPRHIEAVDVGARRDDGGLVSLRACDESYLITTFAPGTIYADDLRRLAREQVVGDLDLARVDALAKYAAGLHVPVLGRERYRRAIRDLVGHGEGIFGIVDSYPTGTPGAPEALLQHIESQCVEWRWRLRACESRLVRTHGDFHPFNIVFDQGTQLTLLDASRGACGDAADDLTALAINYILFAFEHDDAWSALGVLWHRFWRAYAEARPDAALFDVAPPFFAWRALVVCNPYFYPHLQVANRQALLGLASRALDAGHFALEWADDLFSASGGRRKAHP